MQEEYLIVSYMYEQLLYPLNNPQVTKHQRIAYFKYKRKMFIYKIIKVILISILIVLLMGMYNQINIV